MMTGSKLLPIGLSVFVAVRQFEKQLGVGPLQQLICTFSDIKGVHCQQRMFLCGCSASHHAVQVVRCFQRDGVHMERGWRNARDRSTGFVFRCYMHFGVSFHPMCSFTVDVS